MANLSTQAIHAAPRVTEFASFAAFFAAVAKWMKKANSKYSLRWLAKQLNLKSHALLVQFAKGERQPTVEMLDRIAALLALNADEAYFLRVLVEKDSAKSVAEREFLAEKLGSLRGVDSSTHKLEIDLFATINQWYAPAVLEMANLRGGDLSVEAVTERLGDRVSVAEIEACLANLSKLGLLIRQDNGTYLATGRHMATTRHSSNLMVRHYHRQLLERASEALDEVPTDQRFFYGYTFAFSRDRLKEANDLIIEFRSRFAKLLDAEAGGPREDVYHLAIQFIPLTVASRHRSSNN